MGFFAFRHYWKRPVMGWRNLVLHTDEITCKSMVFASASEYPIDERSTDGFLCNHFGDATYTIHNITPFDGGVKVRIHVDYDIPLGVSIDYLVID